LGLGDKINRLIPTKIQGFKFKFVSAGDAHTVALDFNNNVWGFGQNSVYQAGVEETDTILIPTKIDNLEAKHISAGNGFTVVLSDF
jgi:alpha-tubulin suppressor-like RCC1 family protein